MANFKPTLIHCDDTHIELQKEFLNQVLPIINDLRAAFKEFDLGDLELEDIGDPYSLEPVELLKRKARTGLKDFHIKGFKLNPEKVFELMDVDNTKFIAKANELRSEVKKISEQDPNRRRSVYYDTKFFQQAKEGEFQINEKYFLIWSEKNCMIFTKSEDENLLLGKIEKLANSLNDLRGHLKHDRYLAENESFDEMLFWDQGVFKVNRKFFRR